MKVSHFGNLTGRAGTTRTVRHMQRLVKEGRVDPTIIYTGEQIARKHHPKDFRAQANGIFQFVKKHIHYVRDPRSTELLRSPFQTLRFRAGDCDDQAILVCALAESIGLKTRFKTIKADARWPKEFTHIYPQIEIAPDQWLSADTIVPESYLGWEPDERFGSYVWSRDLGGVSMAGFGQAAPQPISINQPAAQQPSMWKQWGQNFMGALMSGVTDVTKVAINAGVSRYAKAEGVVSPAAPPRVAPVPARAPFALPSWLLPVGVVGAAIAGVVLIKLRRRKK